ncbi:alanine racemase [Azoarcus sp. L1K30]|uniref:alanine racemase n=1 Tax=Azoarcus sp. L1K30 TaxID=2820277 RepID=UPI001B8205E0|nr:alanine racemase [Azoarcus sp. L1K30]MBR0567730.1 alanine racemase [Azoarcus sp. L1K30]
MNTSSRTHAGALLIIDLDAICENWRSLKSRVGTTHCAAVVKADAYGLGAQHVAPALYRAGCRHFFVAHVDEALALRPLLAADATLYVLHGAPPGAEPVFPAHDIVPVLNSLPQLAAWRALAQQLGKTLPAVLQVDTGMARLGLSAAELDLVSHDPDLLQGIDLTLIMSHLVSAEEAGNPINTGQLARFRAALRRLPPTAASLANSSGIFLGADYHFDLVRPGAALYGIAPAAGIDNPQRAVIHLRGKVIQTRLIDSGTAVGYNHRWTARRPSRIVTVAIGYADGYLRSLSNSGYAHFHGIRLPVVGNVSMDTITIDATDTAEGALQEGTLIDLACPLNPVDTVAERAGTIGYEILTSLGNRYARSWTGGQ